VSLLLQSYDRKGVLLDPKTGRPKLEPPFDKPGTLYAYSGNDDEVGLNLEKTLRRAPDHVRENLLKSRERGNRSVKLGPVAGSQGWVDTPFALLADGVAVGASSAETIMFPIFPLPANYFYPGRTMRWTVMGRQSTVITTPGTITLRLSYSASGVGAVVVGASGAFAPDPTAAATNLTFILQWWAITRAQGTSGSMMGWGSIGWTDFDDASAAALVGNLNMNNAPTATPAVATVDTTLSRALNPSYQSSVTTASMTCHAAILEALT
jgi:hypothetical protein